MFRMLKVILIISFATTIVATEIGGIRREHADRQAKLFSFDVLDENLFVSYLQVNYLTHLSTVRHI